MITKKKIENRQKFWTQRSALTAFTALIAFCAIGAQADTFVPTERNLENGIKNLRIAYDQISGAAPSVKPDSFSSATACIDLVYSEWEDAYLKLVASTSFAYPGLIAPTLEEYAGFMGLRLQDIYNRELTSPGIADVVSLEIQMSRKKGWPEGPRSTEISLDNPQVDLLNRNFSECLNPSFLAMVTVKLPPPNLGNGSLEGKTKYFKVSFTPVVGSGFKTVINTSDKPFGL